MPGSAGRRATILQACLACLCLALFPLRAHDIYTSWAESKLLSDRLELTLTLARSSAHDLLPDAKQRPAITPENFAEFVAPLRTAARDLIRISSAGRPLAFKSAEVKISGDADITFTLVYATPAAGTLRFIVDYLGHLVDGHVATVVVTGPKGEDVGWSPVTMDQPVFQIEITADKPAPPAK